LATISRQDTCHNTYHTQITLHSHEKQNRIPDRNRYTPCWEWPAALNGQWVQGSSMRYSRKRPHRSGAFCRVRWSGDVSGGGARPRHVRVRVVSRFSALQKTCIKILKMAANASVFQFMCRSGAAVRLLPGCCPVAARLLLPGCCPVAARLLCPQCPDSVRRSVRTYIQQSGSDTTQTPTPYPKVAKGGPGAGQIC
jgi:hypothetical protein